VTTGDARGYETVLHTGEDDPYVDAWWPPGHFLGWEHAVVHENVEFLRSVAGHGTFRPSFADGLAVQRVLDAVERSADEGAWVSV
jgi:predicted dehydrogenase